MHSVNKVFLPGILWICAHIGYCCSRARHYLTTNIWIIATVPLNLQLNSQF